MTGLTSQMKEGGELAEMRRRGKVAPQTNLLPSFCSATGTNSQQDESGGLHSHQKPQREGEREREIYKKVASSRAVGTRTAVNLVDFCLPLEFAMSEATSRHDPERRGGSVHVSSIVIS